MSEATGLTTVPRLAPVFPKFQGSGQAMRRRGRARRKTSSQGPHRREEWESAGSGSPEKGVTPLYLNPPDLSLPHHTPNAARLADAPGEATGCQDVTPPLESRRRQKGPHSPGIGPLPGDRRCPPGPPPRALAPPDGRSARARLANSPRPPRRAFSPPPRVHTPPLTALPRALLRAPRRPHARSPALRRPAARSPPTRCAARSAYPQRALPPRPPAGSAPEPTARARPGGTAPRAAASSWDPPTPSEV